MTDSPWKGIIVGSVIIAIAVLLVAQLPTVPETVDAARKACAKLDGVRELDVDNGTVVCRDGSVFHVG